MPAHERLAAAIYVSRAREGFDQNDALDHSQRFAANNGRVGVTGIMTLHYGMFVQYLEGPPSALSILMERIRKDPRHSILHELHFEAVERRRFGEWLMRLVTALEMEAATVRSRLEMNLLRLGRLRPDPEAQGGPILELIDDLAVAIDASATAAA